MEAAKIWEALRRSDAFIVGGEEKNKKEIILKTLTEDTQKYLRVKFKECREKAIGFIVEEFAKQSKRLPFLNSAKAEFAADIFLHGLQDNRHFLFGNKKPLCNPDFLWMRLKGALAEILGIGEVKASFKAVKDGIEKGQFSFFEDNLRSALECVIEKKNAGNALGFFRKRKFAVSPDLKKFLIVPLGEAKKIRVPAGWEIREIEFSYDELVFIGQKIIPGFRPEKEFGLNEFGRYEKFFAGVKEKGEKVIKELYDGLDEEMTEQIFLFVLARERLFLTKDEIKTATESVSGLSDIFSRVPLKNSLKVKKLKKSWRKFFNKYSFLEEKEIILAFLENLKSFQSAVRKNRQLPGDYLKIDLLEYL